MMELPIEEPVQQYLNEIGQYALLTAEQERELAIQVAVGQAARAWVEETGYIDEESECAIAAAQAARKRLANSNLRLVVSIAKKYTGRGLHLLDLIQAGNIGLMRAVEKFDYHKGNRFSTYATWWIRQAVTRAIAEKSRSVRLPVHMYDQVQKVKYESEQLLQRLGRYAKTEELAAVLGKSPEKTLQIQQLCKHVTSLDSPVGEDHESVLGDFLAAPEEDKERAAVLAQMRRELGTTMATLPDRERRILELRYGFDQAGQQRTLEEVGKVLGMTRERARQIEAEAIRRLRSVEGLGEFAKEL